MANIQTTKIFKKVNDAKLKGYTIVSAQGSSRSSKTYNILIWLINYALTNPKSIISICRATMPSLKGSAMRDFFEILNKTKQHYKFNKSSCECYFDNDSLVEFFSCDNEQKLRGRKRNVLYVNEANEISQIAWKQLQLRTTEFSIIDYNPSFSDEHWICEVNKDKDCFHFITTYKDNPFLERKVVEEIEKLRYQNPTLWQVYGLGMQAMVEGLIFDNIEKVDFFPDYCKKEFIGIDFGYTNDPTAIVRVGIVDKDLFIDEISYNTQMLTKDIIETLKDFQYTENQKFKIISESADPRLIDEIHRAGLNIHPVKKFGGSIEAGITKMLEFKIHVTSNSLNVIKEFKNYTYSQDKEGKFLNKPIDAFNHSIDAIRYVILNEVIGAERNAINKKSIFNKIY